MADKYVINKILADNKITDYLANKGINPVKTIRDRYAYHCPIHKGDREPSFIVYNVGSLEEPENYYCYGCHSGTTIIDLVADLESIYPVESFKKLVRKSSIKEDDRIISLHEEWKDFSEEYLPYADTGIVNIHALELLFLQLCTSCRQYLVNNVDMDDDEVEQFHKIFAILEFFVVEKDMDSLREIDKKLYEGLANRDKKYKQKKQDMWVNNPWR